MDKDYNEIWLQAMDTLIVQRLQNLPFDQTIVCKIIDVSKKNQGIYTVSNESTEFEAYSENTNYSTDDQVYVNIPMSDWSQKKQITGRYSTDTDKNPIVYVAPLEKVLPLTTNIVPEGASSSQLVANWPLTSEGKAGPYTQLLFTITDKSINTTINDTLCIKADFKCVLDNYAMRSGSYGVAIRVTSNTGEVIVFDLDSEKDMFGNPYAFTTWISQQQAFKFTESIGNITSIEGFFYQKGDFTYFDGAETVYVPVIENGIVPNIWMQNLEVYFGTDASQVEDNTVKIVANSDLKYQGTNNTEKSVELIWYNKGEGNKFLGFSDGLFDKEKAQQVKEENSTDTTNYYWIQWQLDGQDGSLEDLEFDIKTGQEEQTLTKVTINCRPELSFTELQAAVWLNGNKYKSNFITFTNQTDQANLVVNKDITISIVNNNKDTRDTYPLYGEDNKIINSAEANKERSVRVEATWSKGTLTDSFWQGATITWTIPSQSTMLLPNFGKTEDGKTIYKIEYTIDPESNYKEITVDNEKKIVFTDDGKKKFTCPYHLNDVYHDLYDNNIITCTIKLPNQEGILVATKRIEFSSQGTSGTDYTLVVRPIDDRPYGFKDGAATLNNFKAILYDLNGSEMSNITPALSFLGKTSNKDSFEKTDYNVIKATAKVTWADRNVDLETLYPVCFAADTYSADVPLKLIYDSYGTLRDMVKSGAPLKLYKSGSLVTGNNIWEINFGNDNITDENKKWLPSIGDSGDTLIPPSIYMDLGSKPYLIAKINGEIVWTSPIIIQQYKYGSEVLNNWDGQTTIDNENNRILTNAFAAGNIDNNNAFNGVVMGQIASITKDNEYDKKTGLFGYKSGDQVYGFREDGTAFIGRSGTGRIYFDGNGGTISSGNFNSIMNTGYANAGMYINLQTGELRSKNFYIDSNGDASFNGNITAKSLTLTDDSRATLNQEISNSETIGSISDIADTALEKSKDATEAANTASGKADNAVDLAQGAQSYAESNIKALDEKVAKHLSGGQSNTILGSNYVISPYIGGGYLNIANGSKKVIIDPQNLTGNNYIFQIHNGSNISLGIDSNGNAQFAGKITATGGEIGGFILTDDRKFLRSVGQEVGMSGTESDWAFWAGYGNYGTEEKPDWHAKFQVKNDGSVTCKNINVQGGFLSYWNVVGNGMYSTYETDSGTYYMRLISSGTTSNQYKVGQSGSRRDWRILLGKDTTYNFGITTAGYIYTKEWAITSYGISGEYGNSEITLTPYGIEYDATGGGQPARVSWKQIVEACS